MASLVLQQVSSTFARKNAGRTLDKPIALKYLREHLSADDFRILDGECTEQKVYVWGSKSERVHQYGKIPFRHSLALFRRNIRVYKCGVILSWTYNPALGEYLWGFDSDGQTWSLVYFLKDIRDLSVPASEINALIGRKKDDNWQGLTAVTTSDKVEKVIELVKAKVRDRSNNVLQGDARNVRT